MEPKMAYVTDEFLSNFKAEFRTKYALLYKSRDKEALASYFMNPNHIIETEYTFVYEPLEVEPKDYNADIVRRNIRKLYEGLKYLTPVMAEEEKLWVALAHREYLDYQMGIYETQIATINDIQQRENSLESRTIFTKVNGRKRSLAIHNLALLWWLAYYFKDPINKENPYHLLDFFVSTPYRGNAVALLSSNIISNRNIALGILDAVKYLVETNILGVNRYIYSEPGKLLNEVGGVRILDALKREEIRDLLIKQLPSHGRHLIKKIQI